MLSASAIAPVQTVPLRRSGYNHLAELGAFDGQRVQLLFGTVVSMSPMGTPNARAIARLNGLLVRAAPPSLIVRYQLPLAASDESEPEPDFAIVSERDDRGDDHPATALLVVEVADSSLRLDLGPKAALYASIDVPEYWVVDLAGLTTAVHRAPRRGKYTSVRRVAWSRRLTSSAIPTLSVELASTLSP